MKHLIVYAHPNPESLNHHFKNLIVKTLTAQKHEIEVRDLNQIQFDPILSLADMNGQRMGRVSEAVKQEQLWINWADQITFIYPIWWTGMPAILKGYIDRVFSYGFAYRYDAGVQKGLLIGKKTVIINTQGKSAKVYQEMGMDKALILTSDHGIYAYCGLTILEHLFFDGADRVDETHIASWTATIAKVYG